MKLSYRYFHTEILILLHQSLVEKDASITAAAMFVSHFLSPLLGFQNTLDKSKSNVSWSSKL